MSAPEEEGATETWTYAGRRVGAAGKLTNAWYTAADELVAFTGKSRAVGCSYEVDRVQRDDAGKVASAAIASARFLRATEDPRSPAWRLEDRAAATQDEVRKREASARKQDDLALLTLAEAKALYLTASFAQRPAVLAQVIGYLTR